MRRVPTTFTSSSADTGTEAAALGSLASPASQSSGCWACASISGSGSTFVAVGPSVGFSSDTDGASAAMGSDASRAGSRAGAKSASATTAGSTPSVDASGNASSSVADTPGSVPPSTAKAVPSSSPEASVGMASADSPQLRWDSDDKEDDTSGTGAWATWPNASRSIASKLSVKSLEGKSSAAAPRGSSSAGWVGGNCSGDKTAVRSNGDGKSPASSLTVVRSMASAGQSAGSSGKASDAVCARPSVGGSTSSTAVCSNPCAGASASAAVGATGSNAGAAGATATDGPDSGSTSPRSRMADEAARNDAADQPPARCAAMSSTQWLKRSMASPHRASNSGLAGLNSASQAFITCSRAQAASPNSFRPTIRELPLRVWNARRRVVISGISPGWVARLVSATRPPSNTSRASSRKMSSKSSSTTGSSATAGAAVGGSGSVILTSSAKAPAPASASEAATADAASRAARAKGSFAAKVAWSANTSSFWVRSAKSSRSPASATL